MSDQSDTPTPHPSGAWNRTDYVREYDKRVGELTAARLDLDRYKAALLQSVEELRDARAEIDDYEEVLADHRRLVRELDVAMFGEEGAAKQASLCDLINPARKMREQRDKAWQTIAEIKRDIMEDETFGDVVMKLWQEPLDEVTEQRDRLAEVMEHLIFALELASKAYNQDRGTTGMFNQEITMGKAALQSINQNAGGMARELAAQDSDNSNDLNG